MKFNVDILWLVFRVGQISEDSTSTRYEVWLYFYTDLYIEYSFSLAHLRIKHCVLLCYLKFESIDKSTHPQNTSERNSVLYIVLQLRVDIIFHTLFYYYTLYLYVRFLKLLEILLINYFIVFFKYNLHSIFS